MPLEARYTKLRDGDWGVRLTGDVAQVDPGDELDVVVRKRSGQTKRESVKAIWKGANRFGPGDVVLCQIEDRHAGGGKAKDGQGATAAEPRRVRADAPTPVTPPTAASREERARPTAGKPCECCGKTGHTIHECEEVPF